MTKRTVDLTRPETYPDLEKLVEGDEDRLADFCIVRELQGVPLVESENAGRAHLGNTGPTNSQADAATIQEVGGYDTLEIIVWGRWDEAEFCDVTGRLEAARRSGTTGDPGWLSLKGELVEVSPAGARRGLYCSWMLAWSGVRIGIVNVSHSDRSHWGIHVTIGSLACMERGGERCWAEVLEFLALLGFTAEGNVVSRVDCCVDVPGLDTNWVVGEYVARRCVMRARKGQTFESGLRYTGFCRGSGNRILLRVYDKLAELGQSAEDCLKEDVLTRRRWGGARPEFATRVEFQLRREAIADFSISSIEEFFGRAGEVTGWLCREWFRFTENVPDRTNTTRFHAAAWWVEIQNRFVVAFGEAKRPERRTRAVVGDPGVLRRQVLGCLTSCAAIMGRIPEAVGDVVAFVSEMVEEAGQRLVGDVLAKRAKLETVSGGVRLGVVPLMGGRGAYVEFAAYAGG